MTLRGHPQGPDIDAWDPWTPDEVMAALRECEAPWCVVGGWAIDLFLGRETRTHEDIEIAVPRSFFAVVRECLKDYDLYAVGNNERAFLGGGAYPADKRQCWVLDSSAQKWRLDVMLEPGDENIWLYRRKQAIQGTRQSLVMKTPSGVPFLAPQAVLLFKAAARPKDESDFANVLPHLSREAREWLRAALMDAHPTSMWPEKLC